jgi:cell division protein FtsB
VSLGRWAVVLGLLLALYFALQGGEYSTWDLLQLRREEAQQRAAVEQLTRVVDSLERAAAAIERDPRTQERVARERFGMLRTGEFLYRLVPTQHDIDSVSGENSGKR